MGHEPDPCLPTEGRADGLQERDEPVGFVGGWYNEVWPTRRRDAATKA